MLETRCNLEENIVINTGTVHINTLGECFIVLNEIIEDELLLALFEDTEGRFVWEAAGKQAYLLEIPKNIILGYN